MGGETGVMGTVTRNGKDDKESTPSSDALAQIGQAFFDETDPTRKEYLSQLYEALKTGGSASQIPIVQRAVESSKKATSDALGQADASLASSGLAGTPYASAIKANTAMQGAQGTSNAATAAYQSLLSGLVTMLTGTQSQAVPGLGGAAGIEKGMYSQNAESDIAKGNQWSSMIGSVMG